MGRKTLNTSFKHALKFFDKSLNNHDIMLKSMNTYNLYKGHSMGSVKENLTSKSKTKAIKNEKEGFLGKFSRRRLTKEDAPKTFSDMIEKADECLDKLLITKEAELDKEKKDIEYNMRAMSHLQSMRFHLDMIMDHAGAYVELRDEDKE